jgi:hypothetical protein
MAAVMLSINERAHLDLAGIDTGAEPGVLGATEGPHFVGPGGEAFVAAQSIVGSNTFPNYLRAMRRMDLGRDPRFSTAERRLQNYGALHAVIQKWMLSFRDLKTLDAQLDEAKIASVDPLAEGTRRYRLGEAGARAGSPDRRGGSYLIHGYLWRFSNDEPARAAPAFRGEHNEQVFRDLGAPEATACSRQMGSPSGGVPDSVKERAVGCADRVAGGSAGPVELVKGRGPHRGRWPRGVRPRTCRPIHIRRRARQDQRRQAEQEVAARVSRRRLRPPDTQKETTLMSHAAIVERIDAIQVRRASSAARACRGLIVLTLAVIV